MKCVYVPPSLITAVRDKIEATLVICRNKYGKPLPFPRLEFRQCGRVAGYYRPPNVWGKPEGLTINPDYFAKHYDEQLNVTVPHEVAHYVTQQVFGDVQSHGREWASVMRLIGLKPERCHCFSLEGVKTRTVEKPYQYSCGCVTKHLVTKAKHNKCQTNLIRFNKTGYKCLRCYKPLVYEGFTQNGLFVPMKKREPVVAPVKIIQVFTISTPPITLKEPESQFRTVTKFVDGMLTNVKVPG